MRQAKIKRFNTLDYTGTEAINTICTNLSFSGRNRKRIVITSYMQGAGKSYMCLNILYNMAKRGKHVLLIDADLRRSQLVASLKLETDGEMLGLAHYLAGHCEFRGLHLRNEYVWRMCHAGGTLYFLPDDVD